MRRRDDRGGLWRSRWAAIGAAIAITFGAGGLVAVNAAGGEESSTVMIDPARVLDSRDPVNVGLAGPFASRASQKLRVTGAIATTTGVKTVVPDFATGVLLNVTTVNSTANGFISIRPGDATGEPSTSSLNFNAGDVTPNAVTVALPTDGPNTGQIDITYDAYGASGPTTDILIDVVGYTTSDLLYGIAEALPFATTGPTIHSVVVDSPFSIAVTSVQLTAPFNGHVTVNTTTKVDVITAGGGVGCSITNSENFAWDYEQQWTSPGSPGSVSQLSGTRVFEVNGGVTYTFALRCYGFGAVSPPPGLWYPVITAMYTPAP